LVTLLFPVRRGEVVDFFAVKQEKTATIFSGRGGQIRTDDFLLPKQALYQAELRPERGGEIASSMIN
jgi:hypothetical protein